MSEYNLFQGNQLLINTVAEVLGYETPQEYEYFTKDIFLSAYFYLTKRFGPGQIQDDYKDAGVWEFRVKQFCIVVYLNSSWVSFQMYRAGTGQYRWSKKNFATFSRRDPYRVRYWRGEAKMGDDIVEVGEQSEKAQELLDSFCKLHGIDSDNCPPERFNAVYLPKWWSYITQHNHSVLGINMEEYEKYGEWQNAEVRYALRTLRSFLKNMLSPIWVRDVPYNIKGQCKDNAGCINNIKIELLQ